MSSENNSIGKNVDKYLDYLPFDYSFAEAMFDLGGAYANYSFEIAAHFSDGRAKVAYHVVGYAADAMFNAGARVSDDEGFTAKDNAELIGNVVGGIVGSIAGPWASIAGSVIGGQAAGVLYDNREILLGKDPGMFPKGIDPLNLPTNVSVPLGKSLAVPARVFTDYPWAQMNGVGKDHWIQRYGDVAKYPAYPDAITDGVKNISDIDIGPAFGFNHTRRDEPGNHVFADPGDLPSMSSEETIRLNDYIRKARANDFSDAAIVKGILEGYDLNGPETVVDLPRPHYAGNGDGGSSYGNLDAGNTSAAAGANRNTGAAQPKSYADTSSYFGSDYGGHGYRGVGSSGYQGEPNPIGRSDSGERSDGGNRGNTNYGSRDNPSAPSTPRSANDRDYGNWERSHGNSYKDRRDGGSSYGDIDAGTGVRPVILDLDGDGLEVTALDRSTVFLDTGGDGFLHRTAWAGEGDGVLYFDPDGRNEITEKRQFVFTEWDPTATSDLEALASVFDSNGDGILSAGDSEFAKFKVMVTLADGSTVSKTLAELGITEIDLTADATNIELSDGSVITGKTTFTRADGSTGTVGDMLLAAEAEGHRVEQVESVDGAGTRSLTTTAYATDGSKAYEIFSVVSADGLSVTNRYDDDGDGVIDRGGWQPKSGRFPVSLAA